MMITSLVQKIVKSGRTAAVVLILPILLGLTTGDVAPDFSLKNQDGKVIQLKNYRGKFVLIFFYPKDDTPGCTREACSFRDQYSKIKKLNGVVLGISRQSEKSHQEFKEKQRLPFDLLVDRDGSVAGSFGVKSMPIIGLLHRQSFLVGPDGKVIRFYADVDPAHHGEEVLEDIEKNTPKAELNKAEAKK